MMDTPFHFYPGFKTRILFHIIAWIFVYCFFMMTAQTLFKAGIFDTPVLLYSSVILLVVLVNHYFLSILTLPLFSLKRKWIFTFLHILLLYIFSSFVTLKMLEIIAGHYPEYPIFGSQSSNRPMNHFSDIFHYQTFSWVLTVILFYNILLFLIKFAKDSYESNLNNVILQHQNTNLEISFLRSQIHPHFLFNTLNNIYGMVLDNQRACNSITKLSDLLRFSLYESNDSFITVQREYEFLSDYINLEKMRHTDRVKIDFQYTSSTAETLQIAPLLLVNFVENAFKHGVNANIGDVWVNIGLEVSGSLITFTIENNKSDPELPTDTELLNHGIGLVNTKRRLDLIYPGKHKLTIRETKNTYFVELIILLT